MTHRSQLSCRICNFLKALVCKHVKHLCSEAESLCQSDDPLVWISFVQEEEVIGRQISEEGRLRVAILFCQDVVTTGSFIAPKCYLNTVQAHCTECSPSDASECHSRTQHRQSNPGALIHGAQLCECWTEWRELLTWRAFSGFETKGLSTVSSWW